MSARSPRVAVGGLVHESQASLIAVKSAVAYLPIAAGVVELDTAGLCSANLDRLPYTRLRRPIFPLDSIEEPRVPGP